MQEKENSVTEIVTEKDILFCMITVMTRKYSIFLNEQNNTAFIQGCYKLPLEDIIWIFQKYLILQNFQKVQIYVIVIIIIKNRKIKSS